MRVQSGFTLTEILLAIAIVGIIAALVLPAIVTNYQNRALNIGFEREYKTISGAVKNLAVSENKVNFYSTMMYADKESDTYEETSGKFIKKYLKVSKYCGDSNGDCFADKYYNYNETTHKKEIYEPAYKGACASLKNGASICIKPKIGTGPIIGLIDVNGKKGPNVFGRDLRNFTIDPKVEKISSSGTTSEVLSTSDPDLDIGGPCKENALSKECCDTQTVKKGDACCIHYKSQVGHPCYEAPEPPKSACEIDKNSLDCCKTRAISGPSDACCDYPDLKTNPKCKEGKLTIYCQKSTAQGTSVISCTSTPSTNFTINIHGGNLNGAYILPPSYNSYYKDQWRIVVRDGIVQTNNGIDKFQWVKGRPDYGWTYCNSSGTGCYKTNAYPAQSISEINIKTHVFNVSLWGSSFPFKCEFSEENLEFLGCSN